MIFLCLLNLSMFRTIREILLPAKQTALTPISNMLNKLFKVHKLTPFYRNISSKQASPASVETDSSVLKIVHVGGFVECYYMATPAVKIIEKYPSFILARPEVFRRPWDSVVKPDQILTPGEKFFLVPRRTVRKLRRRIRKPDREVSVNSFASKSSIDVSADSFSCKKDDFSSKSFCKLSEVSDSSEVSSASRKKTAAKKHVRFVGIDVKHHESNNSLNSQSRGGKLRARNAAAAAAWQPSLTAVRERTDE